MKVVPDSSKFTVARKEGMYLGFTSVAVVKGTLVCVYNRSDQHQRRTTDLMVARSADGGRTWGQHQSISHQDMVNERGIWVSPSISALPDGRLIIACDHVSIGPDDDWSDWAVWQTTDACSNQLFWSDDLGKTWSDSCKIDNVGGEPERIHQLSNGVLVFTREEGCGPLSARYYKSLAIFSDDGGKTWDRKALISDDPRCPDGETGLVELTPGRLLAISRSVEANSCYGQPSRMTMSLDYGRTWSAPLLAPVYAHRPIPGLLQSGKVLVTYRNCFGTNATYAWVFDPDEAFDYQPNSFIWDETRCSIKDGMMTIDTDEGTEGAVDFVLYPAQDLASRVEIEAELKVEDADINGCCISAGCWVRFETGRVCLADRAEEGFEVDADKWHRYRIVRHDNTIAIHVDGVLKLSGDTKGIANRLVHFGNRHARPADGPIMPFARKYEQNRGLSRWRRLSAKVANPDDYSLDWDWHADEGYPDQFRRDRLVLIDRSGFNVGDNGYSGWTQMQDGTIVICDYTRGTPPADQPFIRSYVVSEQDLTP